MSTPLLLQGTALALPLRDASVHTVCTSPPYYGLRDYGTGTWQGGEAACTHRKGPVPFSAKALANSTIGAHANTNHASEGYKTHCGRCGATRVDAQLGLEASVEEYVAAMVQVFREVRRVLRDDAVMFINMGDSYHEKQLLGMPWRLAFALQADGWILRSDIIWEKPSCMPESVQDRPTRSHEYIFLFSKQARYFYDAEAVREPYTGHRDYSQPLHSPGNTHPVPLTNHFDGHAWHMDHGGRNARTVWRIPSEATPYAHFATFPTALVRRCLLAGAPSQVCSQCHAPYRRIVERQRLLDGHIPVTGAFSRPDEPFRIPPNGVGHWRYTTHTMDHGFETTCRCAAGTAPSVVLDPFCGSSTTLLVARELGHNAIGVDLSWNYLHDISRQRLGLAALAAWQGGEARPAPVVNYTDLPLFTE